MMFKIPVHSTKDFTFKDGIFSAEESDFRGRSISQRVYDDACDEGFWLSSEKTKKLVLFGHSDTVRDAEGDVLYWVFSAMSNRNPEHLRNLEVRIFND